MIGLGPILAQVARWQALSDLRRQLARQVLRNGTALALPVDGWMALEAEWDARYLQRLHRGRALARWLTDPSTGAGRAEP